MASTCELLGRGTHPIHTPLGVRTIEDEIVQYAGERKIIETQGLKDAENEYEDQIASLLQSLSEQLVITIGPAIVKRLLQKFVSENSEQDDPPEFTDQVNARPESARLNADCYLENEVKSPSLLWYVGTNT